MQAILKALVGSALLISGVAHADERQVQSIDSAAAFFLVAPEVTQALHDVATESGRTLALENIVTYPSVVVSGSPRTASTPVCLQLEWHGGDTISTLGTVTGRVVSKNLGRGIALSIEDVKYEAFDGTDAGRCL